MASTFCPSCSALWPAGAINCPSCGRAATASPIDFEPGSDERGIRRVAGWVIAVGVGVAVGIAAIAGVAYASRQMTSDPAGNHALSAVCDGEPFEEAPAYDPDAGATALLVLDRRSGNWDDLTDEAAALADLVACRTWNDEPVRTSFCDYRDDRTGELFVVEVGYHRANIEVREARTGELIDEHEVTAADESCPASAVEMIDRGSRRTQRFLYPEDEVEAVLDGYRATSAA